MTDTDTKHGELRPVTIKLESSDVTVTGEMVTDHLAITPAVGRDGDDLGYTGGFTLIHVPSGLAVRRSSQPEELQPETLRDIARDLADVEGADWSSVNPFPNDDVMREARNVRAEYDDEDATMPNDTDTHAVNFDVSRSAIS